MTKTELLACIKAQGWAGARVNFSGGGDEGGSDSFEIRREAAVIEAWESVDVEFYSYPDTTLTPDPATQIARALDAYVDDRYGSFAGEFYVSGDVEADVEKGTIIMSGDEDETISKPFSVDLVDADEK